jgi:adenosylcobinamide hydrolase
VGAVVEVRDGGVTAAATVGVTLPTWAASEEDGLVDREAGAPGTINLVVLVPARLDDAALLNVATTATEAKAQALAEHGIAGTGTASDAIAVCCPATGPAARFGGPRSTWGARAARAVHAAVSGGLP